MNRYSECGMKGYVMVFFKAREEKNRRWRVGGVQDGRRIHC